MTPFMRIRADPGIGPEIPPGLGEAEVKLPNPPLSTVSRTGSLRPPQAASGDCAGAGLATRAGTPLVSLVRRRGLPAGGGWGARKEDAAPRPNPPEGLAGGLTGGEEVRGIPRPWYFSAGAGANREAAPGLPSVRAAGGRESAAFRGKSRGDSVSR